MDVDPFRDGEKRNDVKAFRFQDSVLHWTALKSYSTQCRELCSHVPADLVTLPAGDRSGDQLLRDLALHLPQVPLGVIDEAAVDVDAEGAARAEVGDEGEGDDPLVAADVEEAAALEPLPVHELEAGVVREVAEGAVAVVARVVAVHEACADPTAPSLRLRSCATASLRRLLGRLCLRAPRCRRPSGGSVPVHGASCFRVFHCCDSSSFVLCCNKSSTLNRNRYQRHWAGIRGGRKPIFEFPLVRSVGDRLFIADE
mmetsp:Transcript_24741/g.58888  ORF Transcript_24741/g.58888 Transcript_24741/m.58888 type:complete len:256 (-) Transcript_24741:473-1240(-)